MVVDVLPQLFEYGVEARIQLRQDFGNHFLVDLVINSLVILSGCLAVELLSCLEDLSGLGFKLVGWLGHQVLYSALDKLERVFFDLGAAVVGDHCPLVWNVDLLLIFDRLPRLLHIARQTIDRDLARVSRPEEPLLVVNCESFRHLSSFLREFFLLEIFVRHELK